MSDNTAQLTIENQTYELPIVEGSEQEKAVDISKLRGESGYITLDRGFKNTGSTTSAITFLNGEEGILRYRGYPIEDLTANSSFLRVAYLLIYGELPTADEFGSFEREITHHTMVHEDYKKILDGFPASAHPMGVLSSLVCSLTAFYPESLDPNRSKEEVNLSIMRILAKIPTFAAWVYKHKIGHPVNYPDNKLDYCSNFLKMMFALPQNLTNQIRWWPMRWTSSLSCTPIMSKTALPLPCGSWDRHKRACTLLSQRVSMHCGDRCTAAPTRR